MVCLFVRKMFKRREGCAAEPPRTITAILSVSKWSLLLLRIVLQDLLSADTKICPSLILRVFVDDITALVKGTTKEMAKNVMTKLKEEVEKKLTHVVSH